MKPVAIVLNGELKSALSAVRSLGKADIRVVAGSVRETGMALHSRYTSQTFTYPDPKEDQAAFLEALQRQAKAVLEETGQPPVLFCFSDTTHVSVAEHIDEFEGLLHFPLPPKEHFVTAFDKEKTIATAKQLGITTIKSHALDEAETLSYPVVVKPTASVWWQGDTGTSGTAQFVFSAAELTETHAAMGGGALIQPLVLGHEYGVEMMAHEGNVLATFTHARVRSLAPSGGAAVVKETAAASDVSEQMQQQSEQLVKRLNWTGPIMVEWKVERETLTPHLMEINGRFWGSLPLAIAAGVDFPVLYYQLAVGLTPEKNSKSFSPASVRTQHFFGDLRWLMRVWFDQTPLRSILYPNRLWALWLFVLEPLRSKSDVFWWSDLRPAATELIDIIKRT